MGGEETVRCKRHQCQKAVLSWSRVGCESEKGGRDNEWRCTGEGVWEGWECEEGGK